jgi:hypothetical protein
MGSFLCMLLEVVADLSSAGCISRNSNIYRKENASCVYGFFFFIYRAYKLKKIMFSFNPIYQCIKIKLKFITV